MKNTHLLKALGLILTLGSLSACLKSTYGKKSSSSGTASSETEEAPDDGSFVVHAYSSGIVQMAATTRSLTTSSSSSLDFIEDVESAEFTVSSTELRLRLYDYDGNLLSIPASFGANSRFKDRSGLILILLSDGTASTSVVIHKSSGLVFISKDSELQEISLSSTGNAVAEYEGEDYAVLRVRAKEVGATNSIDVGLLFLENEMLAIRL